MLCCGKPPAKSDRVLIVSSFVERPLLPILHSLWCYSCSHTRGRISISSNSRSGNHGSGKPQIKIAVRPASGSAGSIHSIQEHESDSTHEEVTGSSRRTRLRNSIRNSVSQTLYPCPNYSMKINIVIIDFNMS
jgi:hypothetical protein